MPFGTDSASGISRELKQRGDTPPPFSFFAQLFLRNAACWVVDSALQYRAAWMKDTNILPNIIINCCNLPGSKLRAVNEDNKLKVPMICQVCWYSYQLCAHRQPGMCQNPKEIWDTGSRYTVSYAVFLPMTQDPQDHLQFSVLRPKIHRILGRSHLKQDPRSLGSLG